jgi:hypothetical protein
MAGTGVHGPPFSSKPPRVANNAAKDYKATLQLEARESNLKPQE